MSSAVYPLINLYWGRVRRDLIWVGIAVLIISTTQWHISFLADSNLFSAVQTLGRLLTVLIPLLCMLLAVHWFCWSAGMDLTETKSYLHNYLATIPAPTYLLALTPLLGGFVVALLGWLAFQLGEAPFGSEAGERVSQTLRRLPGTEGALLSIAVSAYIWLQAIMWQPFRIRGIRVVLLLANMSAFGLMAIGWISYRSIPVVPTWIIVLAGIVGVLACYRALKNARHDTKESGSPVIKNLKFSFLRKQLYSSKIDAQSHYDVRRYWFYFPFVSVGIIWYSTVSFSFFNIVPWWLIQRDMGGLITEPVLMLFLVPIIMATLGGFQASEFKTSSNNRKALISSFFSTLPITTGKLIQAKFNAHAKTLGITYVVTLTIGLFCHYSLVVALWDLMRQTVGLYESQFLFVLILMVMVAFVVLTQFTIFGFRFAVPFIPLPGFAVFLVGLPLLIVAFYQSLEVMVESGALKALKDNFQFWVSLLSCFKALAMAAVIYWIFRRKLFDRCMLTSVLASVFLFVSISFILVRLVPNGFSYSGILVSLAFLLTPSLGILLYFPLLDRERHS